MTSTAVLVSTPVKAEQAQAIASGEAPRRDYFELSRLLGAQLIYPPEQPGRLYGLLSKLGGNALAMALTAWTKKDSYDVILTDQETAGLILAMLFKLTRTRRGHVMISHYLTPFKKQIFYRWFHAQTSIDRTICYSTAQERVARQRLGLRPDQVALVLHPADSAFWRPAESEEDHQEDARFLKEAGLDVPEGAPLVCSAGREFRDYPTLIEVGRKLESHGVHVVIAGASPWSKRKDTTQDVDLPSNVHLLSLTPLQLRALYRRAAVVAVPLFDVDFQAGSLVAYEAMACGKPVVITRTRGQNDIVQEGETGFYVPVGDASAMYLAVNRLVSNPSLAEQMGKMSRKTVVQGGLNLDTYLRRVVELVQEAGRRFPGEMATRRLASVDRS